MRNFSLIEFQRICVNKGIKEFIFNSENQCEFTPIRYNLHFTIMSTLNEKDVLCFRNPQGYIKLKNVNMIDVIKDSKTSGIVFTVNCTNYADNSNPIKYTFIAQ